MISQYDLIVTSLLSFSLGLGIVLSFAEPSLIMAILAIIDCFVLGTTFGIIIGNKLER